MAIDIKVIPTLRGDEAVRFVMRAEEVMNSNNRVDFCPMRAGISQMLQMTQIFWQLIYHPSRFTGKKRVNY